MMRIDAVKCTKRGWRSKQEILPLISEMNLSCPHEASRGTQRRQGVGAATEDLLHRVPARLFQTDISIFPGKPVEEAVSPRPASVFWLLWHVARHGGMKAIPRSHTEEEKPVMQSDGKHLLDLRNCEMWLRTVLVLHA